MGRRGKRRNIGPGLWEDDGGFAATVKAAGHKQREKRFQKTKDRAADLRAMQRWQLATRFKMLGRQPSKSARDSLKASVPQFLATLTGDRRRIYDFEKHLLAWCETALGTMPRHSIRRVAVLTQLAEWESGGYATSTLNHRLRVLRKLYDVLDADDDDAVNPCAKIARYTAPEPLERGATYDILEGIIACIPDIGYAAKRGARRPTQNKSKIRLRVMAWTGLPPAQIKRILSEHVRWAAKELDVMPRRKGKGVKARRLPLLDEAVVALRDMAAAGAFGPYSNAAPWAAWQRAKKRYLEDARANMDDTVYVELARLVTPLRPYDLRHSFAAMVYETTENQYAVKDLLMHGSLQTSERYIKRAVIKVSQSAIAAVQSARAVPAGANQSPHSTAQLRANHTFSLVPVHSEQPAKTRKTTSKSAV